jgi:DNA-binding MarR family transcriptional regulator
MSKPTDLDADQYRALAELRYQIRRFLAFSESAVRAAGVEPQQHQLLLLLNSLTPGQKPNIRTVAQRLLIHHNSAVELVRRSVERGLVERRTSNEDRREASLQLTSLGRRVLRRLSLSHRSELRSAAPSLLAALQALLPATRSRRKAA